jgi:hypothetical protein
LCSLDPTRAQKHTHTSEIGQASVRQGRGRRMENAYVVDGPSARATTDKRDVGCLQAGKVDLFPRVLLV